MTFVTETNDKVLVQAHQAGDPDAFDLIVERYHGPLHAHALRLLHDHQAAEDAVQETFLRAFRALPRFNGQYRLGGWLHKILSNVCCDEGNRRRREAVTSYGIGEEEAETTPGPETELAIDLPREEMAQALASIPSTHREALYMRVVEDRPYDEVAHHAGITEENARARVSRARAALRRMLDSSIAGILVVLPFLRRRAASPDVPVDDVSSIANVAQPVAQASSQLAPVAQAGQSAAASSTGPFTAALQHAAVQVAPVVQSAAPALDSGGSALAGKVAVAVTVAAAVALPTGAAVHQATQPPERVAPATAEPATTPTTAAAVVMSAAGSVSGGDSGTVPTSLTSTTAPAAADTLSSGSTEREGTSSPSTTVVSDGGEGEGEAPAAAPRTLEAGELAVSEADRTFTLDGKVRVQTAEGPQDATLSGTLYIAPVQGDEPSEPRAVDGTLTVTFADGRTAEIRVLGTAVAAEHPNRTGTYELSTEYRLTGEGVQAPDTGTLTGVFSRERDTGSLSVDLSEGGDGSQPAYGSG